MKISDIPEEYRPREKAIRFGIEKLSDQELLAIIIGSGGKGNSAIDISSELLKTYGNSLELLSKTDYRSLSEFTGLKQSIALRILASFELHNRLNSPNNKIIKRIESPQDVYLRYKYLENYDQEVLVLLMLDLKLRILKEKVIYQGTFESFQIEVKKIIEELILAKAKYFILIHNHPDEDNGASEEDILATKLLRKTAKSLGIKLVDHIIISKIGYSSMTADYETKRLRPEFNSRITKNQGSDL